MKRLNAVLLLMCVAVTAGPARADSADGRGVALGGAYASLAVGAEGMWWNPAVLGNAKLVSVSLGAGLEGGNNALTSAQIAGIVQDDPAKKADALQAIRDEGSWEARVQAGGGVAVTVWKIGVAYGQRAFIAAEDVSPDAAEFALNGELEAEVGRTYDLHGTYTRALYSEMAAGYAHEFLSLIPGVKLNLGGAVKLYQGTDFEQVKTAQTFTYGSPVPPTSNSERNTATSGSGVGVDLGVQAALAGGVIKGALVARNLGAKLTWDAQKESGSFNQATLTYDAPPPTPGDVEQTLPSTYTAAVSASVPVVGTTAASAADLQTDPAEATRFRVGVEQPILGIISFRGGYSTAAGASPALVTFGLGLGTPASRPVTIRVDVGAGIALDGKGGTAGVSAYAAF